MCTDLVERFAARGSIAVVAAMEIRTERSALRSSCRRFSAAMVEFLELATLLSPTTDSTAGWLPFKAV